MIYIRETEDMFAREYIEAEIGELINWKRLEEKGTNLSKISPKHLGALGVHLIIQVTKDVTAKELKVLDNWYWENKIVEFRCDTKAQVRYLKKYFSKSTHYEVLGDKREVAYETYKNYTFYSKVMVFEGLVSYGDKVEHINRLLLMWAGTNVRVENGAATVLKHCMMREEHRWASMKSHLENLPLGADGVKVITLEAVENIFDDTLTVSLDEFMVSFFLGKKASWKRLGYFLFKRGYSSGWLYTQLVEFSEQLALAYSAYRFGIWQDFTKKEDLRERVALYPKYEPMLRWNPRRLRSLWQVVTSISYMEYTVRLKMLYKAKAYINEEDMVQVGIDLRTMPGWFTA